MGASIGERIKALRHKRQLTLAEIAETASLSVSHLSQIERDKTSPSLTTLTGIARVLGVSLRDLFEAGENQVHITRATYQPEDREVNPPASRLRLTNPEGGWSLEVHCSILHPQAPHMEFEPYPGEVLGFVLEGTLAIVVGDEQFELQAGDSIHYDANQSYRLCCRGDDPCTVIWCHSPPR
jgi:transcriptional regulator with XRE-family HTH domain